MSDVGGVSRDETVCVLVTQEASVELAHAVMAGDVERTRSLMNHGEVNLDTCDRSVPEPQEIAICMSKNTKNLPFYLLKKNAKNFWHFKKIPIF